MATPITLDPLNHATLDEAVALLDGLYEHSPWITRAALAQRPFVSLAQLKHAMVQAVANGGRDAQLALLRAHPELAGKAMVDQSLTAESSHEQSKAGLTHCTPAEFDKIQQLNAQYNARFGFPFILAVRGPRGTGLSKAEIIATLERRVQGHPDFELAECLRNVHRIAEIRLNDKFGYVPVQGHQVWDWQEALAQHTDPGYAELGQLTVTYLTDAHLACARQIQADMLAAGCDSATIDAVGNVVGRYENDSYSRISDGRQSPISSKTLLTGSHFDTVRNGGKYDGRLGIYVPLACVQALKAQGQRLPYALEVVAFAEEEGQRYKATFLGSGALTGDFDPVWLDQTDADGIAMRDAMAKAGLDVNAIPAIRRNAADYQGFVEVHIEQGPVLNALDIPLGVVTSINASARYVGEIVGMASHAGTTPMGQRRDAAAAVAELVLLVEHLAAQDGDSVGTVGQLQVPNGSINVVPGRCQFSLDLRAPSDVQRDALEEKVLTGLRLICERRGLHHNLTRTMQASAAPSAPEWQQRWEAAITALGVPLHRMPSGAGHDAMKLHTILPQAMLFVRGLNSGISHNPLESSTSDDMQLAVDAFSHLLHQLAQN
ncbi:MAG: OHCU decarboxylase [Curvibacter sp. RIFCSPHIGHO2_12_FULL_63_18]|uniref:2-oxo-4-hydroxy-4-carboxy-5-ureidoimidazoline decarboxylase n=1 Tax=Rhodoferax sp. TaxID=50421 RepID=UPI0008B19A4A|nr:2-oxo-4-hydroxy-4-carboxy-5-ureidoimidazoline decarboxylase [Rhodoferax sp.]OGO94412.1 MAG: OHCU decarboxylase [Curvibacter sp. GWA2_63_95]OGP04804.1 MAG: OHCU decarboxylase [Curvibacter sp. RIFCSPHIGHO2_12_FULL_63_18]HCX81870.1 2-oxo-4-hydroxy-4-carboxy-5-ureidoimidazoline decarboxylase [Rhodoferax sp.]